MIVISCINQKGGVGKTSTADALAAGLQLRNHRVLKIDTDAQMNFTSIQKIDAPVRSTVYEVLTRKATASQAIRNDLLAASPALSGMDAVLTSVGKEYRLKEALTPLESNYDFCIIDTPPALGIMTINALTASNYCVIPCQADMFSVLGVSQFAQTLEAITQYTNPSLKVLGILLTRYNARTVLAKDMAYLLEQTADQLGTRVFATKIRECTVIKEAQAMKTNIFAYAPKSNGAADYANLVNEILKEVGAHG